MYMREPRCILRLNSESYQLKISKNAISSQKNLSDRGKWGDTFTFRHIFTVVEFFCCTFFVYSLVTILSPHPIQVDHKLLNLMGGIKGDYFHFIYS